MKPLSLLKGTIMVKTLEKIVNVLAYAFTSPSIVVQNTILDNKK